MNKMRELLFRALTKHANWDQKEEKVETKILRHAMKTYSWRKNVDRQYLLIDIYNFSGFAWMVRSVTSMSSPETGSVL